MRELVIASRNAHKVKEIKNFLEGIPFSISFLEKFENVPEIEETGSTYAENALLKATQVARITGCWALGDDTGLEVAALEGKPGLYSARFAGEHVTFQQNNEKLLTMLKGVPESERQGVFLCVMALANPTGETHVVEGRVDGVIATKLQGNYGFGYDALFVLTELKKTFAELTPQEKNRYSHRARALEKVKEILLKI